MRRVAFVLAALAGLAVAAPAQAGSGWAKSNLIMRSGPGTSHDQIVVIPIKARFDVYGCKSWCKVGYGGQFGYVYSQHVMRVRGPLAPKLFLSPNDSRHGHRYMVPIFPPPQQAYIASRPLDVEYYAPPCPDGRNYYPVDARIYYFQGRWLNRPDYFYRAAR